MGTGDTSARSKPSHVFPPHHVCRLEEIQVCNVYLAGIHVPILGCRYIYWFAFPSFVSKPAWEIDDDGWRRVRQFPAFGDVTVSGVPHIVIRLSSRGYQMKSIHEQLSVSSLPFFLVRTSSDGKTDTASVDKWSEFFANVAAQDVCALHIYPYR
jgi:ubiquitin-like modifier-activating enzyme ATG7